MEKNGDFYAGPFLPAKLARRTMTLSHRLFGIRSCNEVITGRRARPCLEYDIKRCIAPCVAEICTEERYGVAVASTRLLLEGRNDELVETLRDRMAEASQGERFEEAAQLRDAMRTVQTLARPPAEGGDRRTGRPRRVRPEGRPERRRDPGLRRCAAGGWSSASSW